MKEISLLSPTRELRERYRSRYAQFRYSLYDLTEHPEVPRDLNRTAVEEAQARFKAAEREVVQSVPLSPYADPGWPGGWVLTKHMDDRPTWIRGRRHPPVWRTAEDAVADGVSLWEIVWTAACVHGPGGGSEVRMLFDDVFWNGGADRDVLVVGLPF